MVNNFSNFAGLCGSSLILIFLLVPVGMSYAESFEIFVTANSNLPGCQDTDTCWSDAIMSIQQYDDVTWYNDADYSISVISGDILDNSIGDSFDSGIILSGKSYTHTFENSGEFLYFSVLQPWMTGSITVEPVDVIIDDNVDFDDTTLKSTDDAPPQYIPEPIEENSKSTYLMPPEPTCGAGTELVNGFCKVITIDDSITCGPGTVMSNGKCVAESVNDDGGGCLIATATYGTELASQVQMLREIRDTKLLNTESGKFFMASFNDVYYSFSPFIADVERENLIFRDVVKLYITPMVTSLSMMSMSENDESSVVFYGSLVIILNGLMYVGMPVVGIVMYRKYRK